MVWSRACFSQACLAIGGYKGGGGLKHIMTEIC